MVTFRSEHKRGSNLTGNDGAVNRTYTLAYSGYVAGSLIVHVQGVYLYEGTDFSISNNVVTLSNALYDADYVNFEYFTSGGSSLSSSPSYATTLQFATMLGIKGDIPMWDVTSTPVKEDVGVGDNSATIFYLDHRNILATTYTLYYGSAQTTTTTLTETTHYTIDKTKGKITLTSAGVTLLSTNHIYAEYSYCTHDVSDNYLSDVLARAQKQIENDMNTSFIDGSATNPQYPSTTEYQASKGQYDLTYFTRNGPLIDIHTALASSLTANASSLSVTAGDGASLPSSGTIIIDDEIITYTGISTDTLTGLSRGAQGSTAAAHSSGADIHTTVVSISGTGEGTAPTWTPLAWESDVFAEDIGVGKIHIYDSQITTDVSTVNGVLLARPDVPNRIRISYLYGYDTIPVDITRLTLLIGRKMLAADNVGASIFKGRNEFNPNVAEAMQMDDAEIERITQAYGILPMGNT